MSEVIEGTAVEILPEVRAVAVVQQPGQVLASDRPTEMVDRAAHLATVLKDIVERQRLFATIQGKKYPQVEAWMTVARMDNVVAREVVGGIFRHEDGSYEATVELLRLSDGMVIGRGSALCGSQGDSPWDKRPEPARRSMAVTRATSRAFRQQYSWIMALAGYEPTPAEEMPHHQDGGGGASSAPAARPSPTLVERAQAVEEGGFWTGRVSFNEKPNSAYSGYLRQDKRRGDAIGFQLSELDPGAFGRTRANVACFGPLAVGIAGAMEVGRPVHATVWGTAREESFDKDGKSIRYTVIEATRVMTDDWTIPATDPVAAKQPSGLVDDLDQLPF